MKKITIILCLFGIYSSSNAQENTFESTGNVGVGTLNPTARLEVNGTMKVDSSLIVKDSLITENDARIGEDLKIEGQVFVPQMDLSEDIESGVVIRDNNGQLKLLSLPNLMTNAYGSDCFIYNFGGGITSLAPSWQSTSVSGSSTGYLFTGSQCPANVGIGTDTPRSRLDVIGTTYTNKIAIGIDPQIMSGHLHMKVPVASTYSLPYNVFKIEASDKQLLNLDHTGLLRVREVKLDAQSWPDYVFRDDYVLVSLSELEQYIEEHGHLPNVPSEKEVQEQGQDLGEMNKILLEKVEELTLHLIEQQKRIEDLEKHIQNK